MGMVEFFRRRNDDDNNLNKILASQVLDLDMGHLKYCVEAKKRQLPSTDVQKSLKEEVLQLQGQLEDQFLVRGALEEALSKSPLLHDPTNENTISKPAKDLIKEIAALELEVVHLEKYLLSLYRKNFAKRVLSRSTMAERSKPTSTTHESMFSEVSGHDITPKKENSVIDSSCSLPPQDLCENPAKECSDVLRVQTLVDSSILRSHSSLSQRSASSFRTCPTLGTVAEAVHPYHSLPLSMLECARGSASNISLGEHLGNSTPDYVRKTPNCLSEEMVKCITAIYCQLAEPPLFNHGFTSSPISFSSAMSESSPGGQHDMRWPPCRENSSFNSWFNNPFHPDSSISGSYFTMAEAFLVYGVPNRNLKRISLLLKAAYDIGGHTISVEMIQSSILGCRLHRPGQWFQSLFFPKARFKAGDLRKAYAIEHPEPLLRFALCSGSHSDPAVRLYTPKRVFQELEMAKEEYIQTTIRVHKEPKILLPKIVESYAKELHLCPAGFAEMIQDSIPDVLSKSLKQCQQGNLWKKIEWIPHNSTFRYLISKELAE
ncbi:unnamed protein product [Ilex paraguariensis]|uniref:Ternary complex factor MIP1 leucine-zipper domain-containing protein n=1 Tax=Ilex paraguariensis TaxID=185542 RepID=A0ABC8RCB7_9AQUA